MNGIDVFERFARKQIREHEGCVKSESRQEKGCYPQYHDEACRECAEEWNEE